MIRQFGEIVRIVIHVVTGTDLRRPPVAAPIVCDHTVAALEEEDHLRVPIVGRQWPPVREDDRLSAPPIFVEEADSVLRDDRVHGRRQDCIRRGHGAVLRSIVGNAEQSPARHQLGQLDDGIDRPAASIAIVTGARCVAMARIE